MMKHIIYLLLLPLVFCSTVNDSSESKSSDSLPLERIILPEGFKISVYASVPNARSMALGKDGTVYVGNRSGGNVYAVMDKNGDFVADEVIIVAENLLSPNGVAVKNNDLYVAEINRILKFPGLANDAAQKINYEVVFDKYPTEGHHGWKYIAFGPDGYLYVPVGAPCNICESEEEVFASITRLDLENKSYEIFAKGVRNTVGFTWHPQTGDMWFTDNGRDMMGDDIPPCELNKAPMKGMHFGYPYCHGGTISDPEWGNKRECSEFVKPAQNLGAHVAPLGLKFVEGEMFPEEYQKHIILAEHGSWNRSKKSGYKLSLVKIKNGEAVSYDTFAEGWLDHDSQEVWGRPVDVLHLKDGSLLVSDDFAGVIYRIVYEG